MKTEGSEEVEEIRLILMGRVSKSFNLKYTHATRGGVFLGVKTTDVDTDRKH
jgi:hypothetical protein